MMSNPKALSKVSLLVHAIAITAAVTLLTDNLNYPIARSPYPSSQPILMVQFRDSRPSLYPAQKIMRVERTRGVRSF